MVRWKQRAVNGCRPLLFLWFQIRAGWKNERIPDEGKTKLVQAKSWEEVKKYQYEKTPGLPLQYIPAVGTGWRCFCKTASGKERIEARRRLHNRLTKMKTNCNPAVILL